MSTGVTLTGKSVAALAVTALTIAGAGALISYNVAVERAAESNRQYQELTRKLSIDLSELTKACERDRKSIDDDRMKAVRALPSAGAALQALDQELDKAKTKRDADTREAQAKAVETSHNAGLIRRERNEAADRGERDANFRADADAAEAQRLAKAKYDAEVERIARMPSESQSKARQEATETYNNELREAEAAHLRAQRDNQQNQQDSRQKAADEEVTSLRRAREQAQWAAEAAEREFQAQLQAAHLRLMTAVTLLPDAMPILATAIERRKALDAGCSQRELDLRAEFRRAADALRIGGGNRGV